MKCGDDFICLIFLTLSHLKHMSPTSRSVSKAIEIKDFTRTALSTHSFKQSSVFKSASVFRETIRGYPIIQKLSCLETSSSPVAGSQTGCPLESAGRDTGRRHPTALRAPCWPTGYHVPYFMSSRRNSSLRTP